MKRKRIATFALLLAAPLFAAGQTPTKPAKAPPSQRPAKPTVYAEPYDFKGIRLGMALSEFKVAPVPFPPEDKRDGNLPKPNCSSEKKADDNMRSTWPDKPISLNAKLDVWTCNWVWPGVSDRFNFNIAYPRIAGYGPNLNERGQDEYDLQFLALPGEPEPRLFYMTFRVWADGYAAIVAALEKRFGKSRIVEQPSVQNSMGAVFGNEVRNWENNTGVIRVQRYADAIGAKKVMLNTMEVRYVLKSHIRYYNERAAAERAKSGPGL